MKIKSIAFFTAFSLMFTGTATAVYADEHTPVESEIKIEIENNEIDVDASGIRVSDKEIENTIEEDLSDTRVTINGSSDVLLYEDGTTEIDVETEYRGENFEDTYSVLSISPVGEGDALVELYSHQTKTSFVFDTRTPLHQTVGTTELAPIVPVILAAIARFGIKYAVKWYTKTQVKKAVKSYVLSLGKNKWNHIMQPKHAWNKVGAKSKEQVAELIGRAVSEGTKSGNTITWKYNGQTIKVTIGPDGQVGNAWVVTR